MIVCICIPGSQDISRYECGKRYFLARKRAKLLSNTDLGISGMSSLEVCCTCLEGKNNLEKYIQYGNAEFKAAVTQQILDATAAQISSELGSYVSKEFLSTEEQEGYTIVHYKATFTKGDVGIRMVFDKDHKVAGQWFE